MTEYVFTAVPDAADSVSVLVPLPGAAMLAGEKDAVTPAGSVPTDKVTAELKPFTRPAVSVTEPEPPTVALGFSVFAAIVKLGVRTVKVIVCVLVTLAPVAVTLKE